MLPMSTIKSGFGERLEVGQVTSHAKKSTFGRIERQQGGHFSGESRGIGA
jgi:hypothetical protein